jgi:hypothetical protein
MTLTNRHLAEVCLLHHSDPVCTCRYLANDELDETKWYCQKLRKEESRKINESLAEISNKSKVRMGIPSGDNCPGYPVLKHLPQGFDAD